MSRSVLSHYVQVTFLGRITQSTPKEICKEHEDLCMLKIKLKKARSEFFKNPFLLHERVATASSIKARSEPKPALTDFVRCLCTYAHILSIPLTASHLLGWLSFVNSHSRVVLEQQHILNITRREGTHTIGCCSTWNNHVMWAVASHPSESNKLREEKFVRLEFQCCLLLKTVNASKHVLWCTEAKIQRTVHVQISTKPLFHRTEKLPKQIRPLVRWNCSMPNKHVRNA